MSQDTHIENLRVALGVMLDSVDYTKGACAPVEMVAACLPTAVIELARKALDDSGMGAK